jgi:purine-binding chemotaxis protein CheW
MRPESLSSRERKCFIVMVTKHNSMSETVTSEDAAIAARTEPSSWSLMPQSDDAQRVLQARAQLLARKPAQQKEEARSQFVCFRLGATERYGIAYDYLEEIMNAMDITPVPCTPPVIAGVSNYRGELLTLLDLKQFFPTGQSEGDGEMPVIVVKAGGVRVGLIVDAVDGNEAFVPAHLAPSLSSAGASNRVYVQGIHEGRVTLLNIGALLADPSLQIDESVG